MHKKLLFGIIISAGCLYYALRGIAFREVLSSMAHADPRWFVLALLAYTTAYILRSIRWSKLLAPIKFVSPAALMPSMLIGFFANNILPFRMGEFVRAHVSGNRFKVSRTASLGTIVLERIYDTIAFLTTFLMVSLFFPFPANIKKAALIMGMGCVGLIVFLVMSVHYENLLHDLIELFPLSPLLKKKLRDLVANFTHGISGMTDWAYILTSLGLSLMIWTLEGITLYLMARGFSPHISLPQSYFLLFFLGLSVTLPQAPGYVGTFELFGVTALTLIGLTKEQSLPIILTIHCIQFVYISIAGICSLWKEGLSLNKILSKNSPEYATESN
jgi:uncharacterized protein (TIRG00374 family)